MNSVTAESKYVRRQNKDTVIVFVHGVTGDAVSTWTNPENSAHWPDMLTKDRTFDDADIYVFAYRSPFLASAYSVDDLIENMRLIIEHDEIFSKHKNVVFLCHSMGGLVVRGYLKRYQDKAPSVPLIFFFSTPTAGAQIGELGRVLSNNPQFRSLLPLDAGNFTDSLQKDWRALPNHPLSKCAYETQKTFDVQIVDQTSATALCDGSVDPIDANHIDIVKPATTRSTSYIAFQTAYSERPIKQTSAPAANQPSTSTDDSTASKAIVGLFNVLRSVSVTCGEVKEAVSNFPPPTGVAPPRKVVDALVGMQETSNLKHGDASKVSVDENGASVHYRVEGLDKANDGSCHDTGLGIVSVSFVVSQPSDLPRLAGFQEITPTVLAMLRVTRVKPTGNDVLASIQPIDAHISRETYYKLEPAVGNSANHALVGNWSAQHVFADIEPKKYAH